MSAGVASALIGGLLGYRGVQTTARYAHLANEPLKRATDVVGGLLLATPPIPESPKIAAERERRPKSDEEAAMRAYISPLDGNYISLRRAARGADGRERREGGTWSGAS
ncbi:MAG: hypothetical protein ACREFO_03875 [Acetobacteraceae bacterium]